MLNPVEEVLQVDTLSACGKGLRHVVVCIVEEEVREIRVFKAAGRDQVLRGLCSRDNCVHKQKLLNLMRIERSVRLLCRGDGYP
jgi:hypothetical protein